MRLCANDVSSCRVLAALWFVASIAAVFGLLGQYLYPGKAALWACLSCSAKSCHSFFSFPDKRAQQCEAHLDHMWLIDYSYAKKKTAVKILGGPSLLGNFLCSNRTVLRFQCFPIMTSKLLLTLALSLKYTCIITNICLKLTWIQALRGRLI